MIRFSGVGSLPGTDFAAAARLVIDGAGERGLGYLPELPARGPWAAMIGRGTGLLADLGAEFSAGEWRLSAISGIDQRRARATLRDDRDRLEELASDFDGELKVAVPGPTTMAAAVFRPLGGRVLGDRGARRDLAQSLTAGVTELVEDLQQRFAAARLTLQVDEPSLPAVLAGRVPTEGGYFRHRSLELAEVVGLLRPLAALGTTVVHCCAPGLPVAALTGRGIDSAGFDGVSLDQATIGAAELDLLGPLIETGTTLFLGCQPTEAPIGADRLAGRAARLLRPLELGPVLVDRLVLTPTCGLAATPLTSVAPIHRDLAKAAALLEEQLLS